jgi:hypothetical protein
MPKGRSGAADPDIYFCMSLVSQSIYRRASEEPTGRANARPMTGSAKLRVSNHGHKPPAASQF